MQCAISEDKVSERHSHEFDVEKSDIKNIYFLLTNGLAPVVGKANNANQWINHHPADREWFLFC